MSGGERTFIDACLTRAIALYLAQNTGRRFDTLFSDEADGPLDPEHKRMFMAMKREVLRLGGYRQEFFITQTRTSRRWQMQSSTSTPCGSSRERASMLPIGDTNSRVHGSASAICSAPPGTVSRKETLMEELFVRPRALTRMREGPLGVHRYLHRLIGSKGYSRDSRRRAAWLVGDFSRWLTDAA